MYSIPLEERVFCYKCGRYIPYLSVDDVEVDENNSALCFLCEMWRDKRERYAERHQTPELKILDRAKHRARNKGLPFNLEPADIVIPEYCPILGIKLITDGEAKRADGTASLDRIVPELGYVKGNIAVMSFLANRLKSNGTAEQHQKIADWMREQPAQSEV